MARQRTCGNVSNANIIFPANNNIYAVFTTKPFCEFGNFGEFLNLRFFEFFEFWIRYNFDSFHDNFVH